MKMIIVLDKICLLGVIGVSVYVGYKIGRKTSELENVNLKSSRRRSIFERRN